VVSTFNDVREFRGRAVVDRDGDKIGKLDEIYLDRETGEPEWALVNTGLFGMKSSFVPLRGAAPAGDDVRVEYSKEQVKDAPTIDPDGELSEREETDLYRHYGLEHGREGDDEAMTRSEEEVRVGSTQRETGRARLQKWVETENVEETVPVRREEARVEREPITDDNVDQALAGPEISEGEHEVVLHEEEPVVEKRTVPKERVRLDKDTVTDEERVSEEVRKERIDVDNAARR